MSSKVKHHLWYLVISEHKRNQSTKRIRSQVRSSNSYEQILKFQSREVGKKQTSLWLPPEKRQETRPLLLMIVARRAKTELESRVRWYRRWTRGDEEGQGFISSNLITCPISLPSPLSYHYANICFCSGSRFTNIYNLYIYSYFICCQKIIHLSN